MAEFSPGEPVISAEPIVVVDPPPLGTHIFELQVQDNLGQLSAPVKLAVMIFNFKPVAERQKPDKP